MSFFSGNGKLDNTAVVNNLDYLESDIEELVKNLLMKHK